MLPASGSFRFRRNLLPGGSRPINLIAAIQVIDPVETGSQIRCGFHNLRREVPRATPKMLTQQLRELKHTGLSGAKVFPVVPPKVEYSLTAFGSALNRCWRPCTPGYRLPAYAGAGSQLLYGTICRRRRSRNSMKIVK